MKKATYYMDRKVRVEIKELTPKAQSIIDHFNNVSLRDRYISEGLIIPDSCISPVERIRHLIID
jgi:hypothetical protein